MAPFRSRRLAPPSAEGRWSAVDRPLPAPELKGHATWGGSSARRGSQSHSGTARSGEVDATAWAAATAQQLLARHGILTREAVIAESVPGGFSTLYPVLKRLEESGRLRRGYFVAGLGAAQFALPGAVDLLRSLRDGGDDTEVAVLAATDPANPYGATLKWPAFAAITAST